MRRAVSANAAAQRRRRARLTEAQRQAEAERNAAQQRARRQREAVREAEAARQRERADGDRERQLNAERQRAFRAAQEEEARRAELEANAARLRQRREEQEEAERQAEREANAARLRQRREEQEEAERQAELEANAARLRQRREEQDEAERQAELAEGARRHQQQRAVARTGGYAPCVVVQGRLYHRIGPLEAPEDRPPSFAQIYISDPLAEDPEAEAAIRLGHVRLPAATSAAVQHRLLDLLGQLQAMLRQVNPWVQDFIMAAEVLAREVEHRQLIISVAARPAGQHARRYNTPEGLREVAVLMGDEPGQHDLVLRRRADGGTGVLQTIDESHRACDPLHFVLLFPLGTTGWHPAIAQAPQPGRERQRMVTTLQFYAYRLQIRPHQDDSLHRAGRLFQEFVCMAYAKVEAIRLKYISTHQREIRADLYQSVRDAVAADAELGQQEQPEEGREQAGVPVVGRRVVLPATFIGGPRHMRQRYMDAMAIVRAKGKPTLFITITCNPKWPEIANALLPGQKPEDRPDLVARVFHLKLRRIIGDLTKQAVFGKPSAFMWVIEFQKRGLPHCHLLLILQPEDRPQTGADADTIVSAELPDPTESPQSARLQQIVLTSMVHNECGAARPTATCMKDGQCSKRFPKPLSHETIWQEDRTYPQYRRRGPEDGGQQAEHNGRLVTNQWVVPYNPLLSLRYECHINVEVCSSVDGVKYIFMYIYKGSDRQMVRADQLIEAGQDEVAAFRDLRSIGASEACWRLFSFEMSDRSPAVLALQVHLEDHQLIFFQPGEERQAVAEEPRHTQLTAWMTYNRASAGEDPECLRVLYPDFPQKYRWDAGQKRWHRRRNMQAAPTIGRVVSLTPRHGDVFYLRVLLHHVPGATTFADLRTVDGQVCDTHQEACRRRGLLQDDQEWAETLAEAVRTQRPGQLRQLFVVVLLFCAPADPATLLHRFQAAMGEDFARRHPELPPETVTGLVLLRISDSLQRAGKTLEDFGLPPVPAEHQAAAAALEGAEELRRLPPIIREEVDFDRADLQHTVDQRLPGLLPDQRQAVDTVLAAVDGQEPLALFLDAPGGTGKTFTFNLLISAVRAKGLVALAVAFSGIAATLLDGGRTFHSRFKAPLRPDDTVIFNISAQSELAQLIRLARLIVMDEAPMAHRHHIEGLDRTLRDLTGSDQLFGGKVVVLGGDFRQVLPVVRHANQAGIVDASLRRSPLWRHFSVHRLRENMRARLAQEENQQAELEEFSTWLLQLGNGELPTDAEGRVTLPPALVLEAELPAVIDWTFGNLTDADSMASRAVLAPTNSTVDSVNSYVTDIFPGRAVECLSADATVGEEQEPVPQEYLNGLCVPGLPPHHLLLKPGMPVILLRNIDPARGLCNGTRLLVVAVHGGRLLEATVACGSAAGRQVLIPRLTLQPPDDAFPFEWRRRQFPVRPAFALTINKAQGQTLRRVAVLLREPVFGHGQLYVAASRVGRWRDLRFVLPPGSGGRTANVVYRDVL
ncbi:uncharacterized protein LOC122381498 [Amphibalanus amphitrite]|uniref:uncharacterized protein LOC122381498 n=1 Tax=Amphibalanus amphitrite TaxID=1232801 RepID=UPI001C90724D|nr:uncharacterized protein LOC122381498 [Amphibalanus amphitrite]